MHGRVVSISDGDSITIIDAGNKQHKIRLLGIDAPEINQSYGQKSKQSLFELVNGRQIEIEFKKKDKFGRTIGKVFFKIRIFVLSKSKEDLPGTIKNSNTSSQKRTAISIPVPSLKQEVSQLAYGMKNFLHPLGNSGSRTERYAK